MSLNRVLILVLTGIDVSVRSESERGSGESPPWQDI